MNKKKLLERIEQACRDKEIAYSDLLDLGLKYHKVHIEEIILRTENSRIKAEAFMSRLENKPVVIDSIRLDIPNLN